MIHSKKITMKKIILSLVFILGITTIGNTSNTIITNTKPLLENKLDINSDNHLALENSTILINNLCFDFAAEVFIVSQKSGESFQTSLTLFYQMKKSCEALILIGLLINTN